MYVLSEEKKKGFISVTNLQDWLQFYKFAFYMETF